METKITSHREGTILQLTSFGFVALMRDRLYPNKPDDTEEFPLSDVSEPDLPLVKVGAKFQAKSGYRRSAGMAYRAWWLEFEGSVLEQV